MPEEYNLMDAKEIRAELGVMRDVAGTIPAVWLALLLAPYVGGGLVGLVHEGGAALNNPFHIVLCEDSLKTVLIFMLCYGLDGRKHRRNLNILVCGGSGAGKTRFFAKPNIPP